MNNVDRKDVVTLLGNIGGNVRHFRRLHYVNQAELGKAVGCSRQTISQYERGTHIPPTDKLVYLAEVFGIGVQSLVYGNYGKRAENAPVADEVTTHV